MAWGFSNDSFLAAMRGFDWGRKTTGELMSQHEVNKANEEEDAARPKIFGEDQATELHALANAGTHDITHEGGKYVATPKQRAATVATEPATAGATDGSAVAEVATPAPVQEAQPVRTFEPAKQRELMTDEIIGRHTRDAGIYTKYGLLDRAAQLESRGESLSQSARRDRLTDQALRKGEREDSDNQAIRDVYEAGQKRLEQIRKDFPDAPLAVAEYRNAVELSHAYKSQGRHKEGAEIEQQAKQASAGAALKAIDTKDWRTVEALFNVHPDGHAYKIHGAGADAEGNQFLDVTINGTREKIGVDKVKNAIMADAYPKEAFADRAALSRERMAATRDNLLLGMAMRGIGGGSGGGTGGSGGTGTGKAGGGMKYATHDDFSKQHKDENGKPDADRADHAYLTYQQLRALNPKLNSSEPGEAAARMLANQYASGKIQATPEIMPDGRWAFVLNGSSGIKYLLDKPEGGIDATSLKGADGKPRVDQGAVDKAEGEFIQNIAIKSPDYFAKLAPVAMNPAKWSNVLAAYDAVKSGRAQMSTEDKNELRSQVMIGEMIRRLSKQQISAPAGGERQPASQGERFDAEVRSQRSFGRLTPDAMVSRGVELGVPAAIEEQKRREGAAQPREAYNAGGVGYMAP